MNRRFLVVVALLLLGAALAHNVTILSDTPVNREVAMLLKWVLAFSVVIFGGVAGFLLYTIVKFRARRDHVPGAAGEALPAQFHENARVEFLLTLIPLLIVLLLFVLTAQALVKINRPIAGAMPVEVTARQFWWDFKYPDEGFRLSSEMVIPVGRPVEVKLTAADVIHSFWVPSLAGKTDAIPGETTYNRFQATKPGNYYGYCAELCGPSHANMRFRVIALDPDEYQRFAEAYRAYQAPEPRTEREARGQQLFLQRCAACHTVKGTPAAGVIGPDLSILGNRVTLASGIMENTRENLIRWIEDPAALKPGAQMPAFKDQLSNADLEALADYLESLKLEGFDFKALPKY